MDLWACAIVLSHPRRRCRVWSHLFSAVSHQISMSCPSDQEQFKENQTKKPPNLASSLKIASQLTELMSQSHCLIVPPVVPSCLTVR
jgi:hypothetical protein